MGTDLLLDEYTGDFVKLKIPEAIFARAPDLLCILKRSRHRDPNTHRLAGGA